MFDMVIYPLSEATFRKYKFPTPLAVHRANPLFARQGSNWFEPPRARGRVGGYLALEPKRETARGKRKPGTRKLNA